MERQDETSGGGCHGTFGIHPHNDLFYIQGPNILSEIRYSHGQSSVPNGCRHFHGIPRAVGHSISSSWMQTQVVETLCWWYDTLSIQLNLAHDIIKKHGVDGLTQHQEARCRWADSTSEFSGWHRKHQVHSWTRAGRADAGPSSTPSLCGRPMDVWSYWCTKEDTHGPVTAFQFSPSAAA